MPGRNSLFDASKLTPQRRFLALNMYKFVIAGIAIASIWGWIRFYFIYPHLRFSLESLLLIVFFVFCDAMTISGILKTKDADPGYLIPPQDDGDAESQANSTATEQTEAIERCRKCGYYRTDIRTSHCSRCNRCVDYMDHHCFFTDNCIGRRNYRYFFQFVIWADIALVTGFIVIAVNFETRNLTEKYGAQGIAHWFEMSQKWTLHKLIVEPDEVPEVYSVVSVDALLCFYMFVLTVIVTLPGISTLNNLRTGTSEVLKLKARNGIKVAQPQGSGSEAALSGKNPSAVSWAELMSFIYGPRADIKTILFASFYD